ncbi:hypothetical protein [Streptomyces morookaense]|uniref:Uncharacterized protein n=1 Tax=Streptomyces morookaense TaxID=1970 RepID=A0A7Y7B907_STRMO|nr:hypothetical protein [Streptomyces morookaense]NVK81216.1 hypothetical protein [Streptomyces morookaense]
MIPSLHLADNLEFNIVIPGLRLQFIAPHPRSASGGGSELNPAIFRVDGSNDFDVH